MTAHHRGARAAFLDRDGVINFDAGYVHHWSAFEFLPGAVSAMADLQSSGYRLVVITNQSGIARGIFSEDSFRILMVQVDRSLRTQGVTLSGVYHCPHHPEAAIARYRMECDCRKPAPGLIFRALEDLNIDPGASVLIGDKASDIRAGKAAGIGRNFIVRCNGRGVRPPAGEAEGVFDDLAQCVAHLGSAAGVRI